MKTRSEQLLEIAQLLQSALVDRIEGLAVADVEGKKTVAFGVPDIRRAASTAIPEVFDTLKPAASATEVVAVWDAVVGMNDAAFKRAFRDTHKEWVFPESKERGLALRLSC